MIAQPPIIELQQVCKVYGRGDSAVAALAGANLRIQQGEFVAIMGASGSGKSTCLNVLGCLDQPTSGAYLFAGVDVARLDPGRLALLRRHYLGFVFQSFYLLPRTSALEKVELPLVYRRVPAPERRRRALDALSDVGLGDRALHTPAELSGGQQQRVAIARALVSAPKVILADEPTGNLDSARKAEIMALLAACNRMRGITIVMVTHELDMAEFADRIIVFADGRISEDRRKEG
jgi:putative ABC transport system ATP-binding protein